MPTLYKRSTSLFRRKPLRKVSRSKRRAYRAYTALASAFLNRPEARFCLICMMRAGHGENIPINRATEIHHWAGRIGRLLCYVPYFRSSCFNCRMWPHDHPKEARGMGFTRTGNAVECVSRRRVIEIWPLYVNLGEAVKFLSNIFTEQGNELL